MKRGEKREKRTARSSRQTKSRLTHSFLSEYHFGKRLDHFRRCWRGTLIHHLGMSRKKLKIKIHQGKNYWCGCSFFSLTVWYSFIAELREGPPSGAPNSYRKKRETHELSSWARTHPSPWSRLPIRPVDCQNIRVIYDFPHGYGNHIR